MRTLVISVLLLLAAGPTAFAQQSATCVTPTVRCRAPYPGPVGAACSCQTPTGWVRGRLG